MNPTMPSYPRMDSPAAGRIQGYRPGTSTPRSHRVEVSVEEWAAKEAQGYTLPRSTFTHVYNSPRVQPWSDGLRPTTGASPDWGGRRALPQLSSRSSMLSTLTSGVASSAMRLPPGLHASPERNFGHERQFVPNSPRQFAGRTYNTFAQRFRVEQPAYMGAVAPLSANTPVEPMMTSRGRQPLPMTAGKTGWSRADHRF